MSRLSTQVISFAFVGQPPKYKWVRPVALTSLTDSLSVVFATSRTNMKLEDTLQFPCPHVAGVPRDLKRVLHILQ